VQPIQDLDAWKCLLLIALPSSMQPYGAGGERNEPVA
jgi:hypothetical protein